MKKLVCTIVIGFLLLNVIRVTTGNEVLSAKSFLEVTQYYFEQNNIGESLNSSYNRIMIQQAFTDAFDTEIIYEAGNMLAGFFDYVMQAVGGIGEILQLGISWMWNITIGWVSKLIAYILMLFGVGT